MDDVARGGGEDNSLYELKRKGRHVDADEEDGCRRQGKGDLGVPPYLFPLQRKKRVDGIKFE